MADIIKWGIMGPGTIAHSFAKGLDNIQDAEIYAVASHSVERAEKFAEEFNVKKAYGNYEDFLNDPEIDVVYISTTNQLHKDCVLMCLKAGKPVICEKPFTINAKDAKELINCARDSKVFLMEAMWTRYIPSIVKLREIIDNKDIGEITQVRADFCFKGNSDSKNRLLDLNLGGGALLDVGVYVVSFANMILGDKPLNVMSKAFVGPTGVDEQFSSILSYDNGKLAFLNAAINVEMPQDAYVIGTKGYIHIPNFWHGNLLNVHVDGENEEILQLPYQSTGYNYEALEVMKCIREGKTESLIMPLDETLAIIETMDEMRKIWNLKYPFEK